MKRRTKIGIGCMTILLIPVLFLIGLSITEKIQLHISQTKATQVISQLVPKEKQIIIETRSHPGGMLDLTPPDTYVTTVTTQKDYELWKKLVLQHGQLLSSDHLLPDGTEPSNLKAFVKNIKHCEINYESEQSIANSKPDMTNLDMGLGSQAYYIYPDPKTMNPNLTRFSKTWQGSLQIMYDHFAYLPSNTDLVKKWRFPANAVQDLAGERK
ncbi:hypothetical protein [Lacticaseibacillus saniviri]|nr:hypothetical protein [Lacticaseibacillus saniviri]MCG4281949.1 hypothetical protein [Lacticaseibacillus saniviri]